MPVKSNLATISEKVHNIERTIMGNGIKGLLRKYDELVTKVIPKIKEDINTIKNYNHIKNWVLGGAITLLIGVLSYILGKGGG